MSFLKKYKLRGLNLKDSDINRDGLYASDLQNVELNDRGEIVKRFGYDQVALNSGGFDLYEFKKKNQMISIDSSGLKKYDTVNDVWIDINNSGSISPVFTAANFGEYNGVLYWTDPDGENELYKYDGGTFYRAGVPRPSVTTSSGVGSFFYRVYIEYRDASGNITSSDYEQFDNLADGATFEVQQMGNGFYEKYGSLLTGNYTIDTSDDFNDIDVNFGHNYQVGDYLVLGDTFTFAIPIYSLGPNLITLDTRETPDGYNLSVVSPAGSPIEQRTKIVVAKSSNATFGYRIENFNASQYDLNKASGPATITAFTGNGDLDLEERYDSTIVKGLPPRYRYLSLFNNIMILGNNANPSDINALANKTDPESSIAWSDTGLGSTVETFPPFNVDSVGKTSEGEISGLFASSDYVAILKESQVYYLNGNLISGTYRIISALTNGIGCVSYKSIQEIEGGFLFMSSRGLYHGNGRKPVELSAIIEPLFSKIPTLELDSANTINDVKREKLYISIQDQTNGEIAIVYDYQYREWFLHRNILSSRGMVYYNDELYHMDSTSLYKRSSSYSDNGNAIYAYYRTAWDDLNFPSLVKKWKKAIILSISKLSWLCTVKTQFDWDEDSAYGTNNQKQIVGPTSEDFSLSILQKKSMRLSVENAELNEGMHITGIEVEVEETQRRPKGND